MVRSDRSSITGSRRGGGPLFLQHRARQTLHSLPLSPDLPLEKLAHRHHCCRCHCHGLFLHPGRGHDPSVHTAFVSLDGCPRAMYRHRYVIHRNGVRLPVQMILVVNSVDSRDSVLNVLTDFIMLAMPVPFLWRLNVSQTRKVQVFGIFALGGWYVLCPIQICRSSSSITC